ncbi:MAG: DNA mismatch repair endonuclease MutL [Candidatus Thorarchaeota archaeon]|nr:DNA mismatch repair endonuclease MutL [Candidatus Thorarchaeota archaeon]
MGKVRVLTEDLVSLISAGEVIENPSSIVKELIENSLDAGADMVDVMIEGGGIKTISVSDNGSGILKEDCRICLQRYSTSKISTRADLDRIVTYGFRGEALASIASVADIKIVTRTEEEETGTLIQSRFGKKPTYSEISRPRGTTVEVRDLFRNIAARRKHLADAKVESQRIQEVVMKHAAIRPEIGFRLIRDGETIIDSPPSQTATDRIASLWGSEIAKALIDVDFAVDNVRIHGFVARPPVSRGNRSREYFSVVKRPVTDEKMSQALESVFSTTLMKGQYPICALDVSIDLSKVDVNVHPTKREVRILDINEVCTILKKAVRYSFGERDLPEEVTSLEDTIGESLQAISTDIVQSTTPSMSPISHEDQIAAVPLVEQMLLKPISDDEHESLDVAILGGVFRIIGQIHNLYILLEFDDGLLIVDQHAAHERVLYEQLRKEMNDGTIAIQELLQPFVLSLSRKDAEQILGISDILDDIGYTVSSFGGNDISISTLPEIFGRIASEKELMALVDRIIDLGQHTARETFMDELVKVTACHSAIRSGQPLNTEEIRNLLVDLSKTKSKYNCCHGRPSMLKILKDDIDRSVGRMGPDAISRYRARHGLK